MSKKNSKKNKWCVHCGKGVPNWEGVCSLCGGVNGNNMNTEIEGMPRYTERVERTVESFKEMGARCISVELDYVSDFEYDVILAIFRRVAKIAGMNPDTDGDEYWVIQRWMA